MAAKGSSGFGNDQDDQVIMPITTVLKFVVGTVGNAIGIIQGTAQEIMKEAMLRVDNDHLTAGVDTHPLLQIYDELVFETTAKVAESVGDRLSRVMATTLEGVAITTSWSVAESWGGLK